jgi:arylformamidase
LADRKFYDISVSLGGESMDFPGDTPYKRTMVQTLEDGDDCNLSGITMSAHAGTHVDAPYHFFKKGKTIDQFPVEKFILSAWVVPIQNGVAIEPSELENVDVRPGEAVLFKTRNSTEGRIENGVFQENFVYLSARGADWCVRNEVGLVGIDYISIEKFGSKNFTIHRKILSNDTPILEGINLKSVPEGRYTLYCFPLKIRGGDGAPVRAVLMA